MYEKEMNLIDVSFIFNRKLAFRECVLQGPKMLKIDFGEMAGNPMCLALWPRIFRLLGRWPTGQKFQNHHCCRNCCLPLYHTLTETALENTVGKDGNAGSPNI